ncbi:hypothetical protein ACU4GD_30920 [Cupriavidus basilensis]
MARCRRRGGASHIRGRGARRPAAPPPGRDRRRNARLAASRRPHRGGHRRVLSPKLSLSALLGFESLSAGKLFSAAAFQPLAAAGLRWRLFDFGRVDAEGGAGQEALRCRSAGQLPQGHVARHGRDVENAIVTLTELESQGKNCPPRSMPTWRARGASGRLQGWCRQPVRGAGRGGASCWPRAHQQGPRACRQRARRGSHVHAPLAAAGDKRGWCWRG